MQALRRKYHPIFFSLLVCFFVILIFPIVIGSYIFTRASTLYRQRSIEAASFVLQQSALTFDRFIETSDNTVHTLAVDPAVQIASRLDRPAFTSKDILSFRSLIGKITAPSFSDPLQSEMIILLNKPNAVIRNGSVSFGIRQYYNNFLRYENYDYDQWAQMISSQPLNHYFIPSQLMIIRVRDTEYYKEYIAYVHSFSMMTSITLIDSDKARGVLAESVMSGAGAAFIADQNGNVVLQAGSGEVINAVHPADYTRDSANFQNIGGEQMIVLRQKSPYNGILYVSVNPVNEALHDLLYLQKITVVSVCVILLIGLLTSYFMSRQYTKPIREVIALLDKRSINKKKIGSLKTVKDTIFDLVSVNEELSVAVSNQTAISKTLFFDQLLNGMLRGEDEVNRFINYLGLNLQCSSYAVLQITWPYGEEGGNYNDKMLNQDIFKLTVDKFFKDMAAINSYCHLIDNKKAALILCLNQESKSESHGVVAVFLNELLGILARVIPLPMTVGVGTAYRRLYDISFSFVEAQIAMDHALYKGESVVWYDRLDNKEKFGYFYPPDFEQKLITLAKMGKKDELLHNLHQIYKENFTNRSLVRGMQTQLFYEMRSTVKKILDELKYEVGADSFLHLDFAVTTEYDVLQSLTNTYILLCDTVNKKKKSHNKKLIDEILKTINEQYNDSNMSVEGLADQFNISPAYFSRFFREQTGEVFSGYLENLRIKQACEFLKETDWSVDRIAMDIGYNSAYSFRRAFKKKMDIVPTEYRKSIAGG